MGRQPAHLAVSSTKMDIRESLTEQFVEYGVDVGAAILDKCAEICLQHGVDAEKFVESWMAFSISNGNQEISLEVLAQMERKEFARSKSKDMPTPKGPSRQGARSSNVTVYNTSSEPVREDSILSAYSTPKRNRVEKINAELHTPESYAKKRTTAGRSPHMDFSPASFSPSVSTPSSNYSTRTNAGQVVADLGSLPSGASWKSQGPIPDLRVGSYTGHGQAPLSAEARYMYERLTTKACVLNDVVEWLGKEICQKHGLGEPDHLKLHSENFVGVGRICCDANGKLNSSSVLLEAARGHPSYGVTVPLNLSSVSQYAIFPGQVIAVEGTNPTAERLLATKVFSDAPLPLPSEPLKLSVATGPLHVVIASGPFTQSDNMKYQPLEDLVMYVQENQPHVLILSGPFLDCMHPQILDNGLLAVSFSDYFDKIVDNIMRPLSGCHTEVVLIPSSRDVQHQPVYPTPPYVLRKSHPRLHLLPDPALLDVNGIIFGITATDILMHIGREEVCNPPQGPDRLGRLASHLINQRCMYPLYPPPEELSIDVEMWDDHTHLPVTPHVLVLPSDFSRFLKTVQGSLIVNPGRLAKGSAGGTFVRMCIKPVVDESKSLVKSTCAQVVRI